MDTVLQLWFHKCGITEKNDLCWPAGYTLANTAQHGWSLPQWHCCHMLSLMPTRAPILKSCFLDSWPDWTIAQGYSIPCEGPGICLCWLSWGSCQSIPSTARVPLDSSPALQHVTHIPAIWYHTKVPVINKCIWQCWHQYPFQRSTTSSNLPLDGFYTADPNLLSQAVQPIFHPLYWQLFHLYLTFLQRCSEDFGVLVRRFESCSPCIKKCNQFQQKYICNIECLTSQINWGFIYIIYLYLYKVGIVDLGLKIFYILGVW